MFWNRMEFELGEDFTAKKNVCVLHLARKRLHNLKLVEEFANENTANTVSGNG